MESWTALSHSRGQMRCFPAAFVLSLCHFTFVLFVSPSFSLFRRSIVISRLLFPSFADTESVIRIRKGWCDATSATSLLIEFRDLVCNYNDCSVLLHSRNGIHALFPSIKSRLLLLSLSFAFPPRFSRDSLDGKRERISAHERLTLDVITHEIWETKAKQ